MTHSRLVLLVEDNGDDAELARRAFAMSNIPCRVVVAVSGEEALDYLFAQGAHAGRARDAMPDVVLLDLKLPGLSGHGVLRRIRGDARTSRLPVVMLSSSGEESDIGHSYDGGANSYVRKPLDLRDFLRAVAQLGEYWLERNEIAWDWSSPGRTQGGVRCRNERTQGPAPEEKGGADWAGAAGPPAQPCPSGTRGLATQRPAPEKEPG